jgi:hypothetical protein
MIIKMDIEGGEWESFLAAPDELLASIPQLAMEMHGFDDPKIVEAFCKLKKNVLFVNVRHPQRINVPRCPFFATFQKKPLTHSTKFP